MFKALVVLRLCVPCETKAQEGVCDVVSRACKAECGGYTVTEGVGVWGDYRERVRIFEVWADEDACERIVNAFEGAAKRAGEEAVGYVLNGVPNIVQVNND